MGAHSIGQGEPSLRRQFIGSTAPIRKTPFYLAFLRNIDPHQELFEHETCYQQKLLENDTDNCLILAYLL